MFGSIKNAFKILCNKEYPWQEKVFEAAKILSAGAVAVLGFSLNEILEKGLTFIHMPYASFVAECLAGLFAGLFSNVVLMLFDHTKGALKVRDAQLQLSLLQSQSIFINELRIDVTVLKSSRDVYDTYKFFGNAICVIDVYRNEIKATEDRINNVNERTKKILEKTDKRLSNLENRIGNDSDF